MNHYSNGPYRSNDRIFFGVCRGLADYFNFSVFWTRMLVVIAFLVSGFFPVGAAYLLLALLMKPEPYGRIASAGCCAGAPPRDGAGLDDRIRRTEASLRAKEYDWDQRLQRG